MLNHYLSLLKNGEDRSKFEEMYYQYRSTMYYAAYAVVGEQDAAEDAVHEAFVHLANNMSQIQGMSEQRMEGFLCVIARAAALDMLRDREPQPEWDDTPLEEEEDVVSVQQLVEQRIMGNPLIDLIHTMEQQYVDVLLLKYYHDKSSAEIAEMLGITESLVNVRLHRARQKLKKRILEEGLYDGSPV